MKWLTNFFKSKLTDQEKHKLQFLVKNEVFQRLNRHELILLLPLMYEREYNQNEVVFFRNDPSMAVYILKEGTVEFFLDMNEKEEKLFEARRGQVFGQNGAIEKSKRNYSAKVTSEAAKIYALPQLALFDLMDKHPALKLKIKEAFLSYYAQYVSKIFKAYRLNNGFFEINQIYQN